jgi:mRNA interferase HigB
MHVISQKRLREFWADHPDAEAPLRAWYKIASRSTWQSVSEVRATCSNSVDQVGRCTVFNIGGNKYRLIARTLFQWGRIYILHVLTHEQYSRGAWKADCG